MSQAGQGANLLAEMVEMTRWIKIKLSLRILKINSSASWVIFFRQGRVADKILVGVVDTLGSPLELFQAIPSANYCSAARIIEELRSR